MKLTEKDVQDAMRQLKRGKPLLSWRGGGDDKARALVTYFQSRALREGKSVYAITGSRTPLVELPKLRIGRTYLGRSRIVR